jgi:hypothetical protein
VTKPDESVTVRDERLRGLRGLHATEGRTVATEGMTDCTACGCRAASCETKVWLSGRKCCQRCDHDHGEAHGGRVGTGSDQPPDPASVKQNLPPRDPGPA